MHSRKQARLLVDKGVLSLRKGSIRGLGRIKATHGPHLFFPHSGILLCALRLFVLAVCCKGKHTKDNQRNQRSSERRHSTLAGDASVQAEREPARRTCGGPLVIRDHMVLYGHKPEQSVVEEPV